MALEPFNPVEFVSIPIDDARAIVRALHAVKAGNEIPLEDSLAADAAFDRLVQTVVETIPEADAPEVEIDPDWPVPAPGGKVVTGKAHVEIKVAIE